MKDSWRDDRRPVEGNLYAQIGAAMGVAKLYSFGKVQVDGRNDSTSNLIRCNLQVKGPPRKTPGLEGRKDYISEAPAPQELGSKFIPRYNTAWWDREYLPTLSLDKQKELSPLDRTHSQLIMETYGWPISTAKSLDELVGSMRDAILGSVFLTSMRTFILIIPAGHHNSYTAGVLHRDISLGNIIITGKTNPGERGVLIDYDNAIEWKYYKPLIDDLLTVSIMQFPC